ncbi:hypothetical protein ABZX77_17925 [Streptomyces sp. NPDC004237]|uniref:hypothetical protein n=1 Tax=Streptomyces sp. NPDC004237 TaxID=3154455 RepID=UPI00339DED09
MTGVEEGTQPHPVVRTFVGKRPGRARARWSADSTEQAAVRDAGVVRVQVGAGLRPQDVPAAVRLAQSVRNAAVVEVVGSSRRAVEHAKQVFLAAWSVELPEGGPASGVGAWAALMLAQDRDGGKDAQK